MVLIGPLGKVLPFGILDSWRFFAFVFNISDVLLVESVDKEPKDTEAQLLLVTCLTYVKFYLPTCQKEKPQAICTAL